MKKILNSPSAFAQKALEGLCLALPEVYRLAAGSRRVVAAVDAALREFHRRPCLVGRARMFGDKTIGMDDPGMVAFRIMLGAL